MGRRGRRQHQNEIDLTPGSHNGRQDRSPHLGMEYLTEYRQQQQHPHSDDHIQSRRRSAHHLSAETRNIRNLRHHMNGMAITKTISLGVIALLVVVGGQFLLSLFGVYTPTWLEIGISGIGVFIFAGAAIVDFYILPRSYRDDQYLPAALSMYLTYINLFIFILRLLIAINGRD